MVGGNVWTTLRRMFHPPPIIIDKMKKFLFCVLVPLLLFPVSGYADKKDKKKGPDRKLVLVDEDTFKKKVDELIKSDTYKELDKTQRSLIRTFVETFARQYADEFTYGRSEREIQSSLDSIDVLVSQRDAAETASAGLRKELDSLQLRISELDAKLAEKDKEVGRLMAEVNNAQTQGSRALQIVSDLSSSLEKSFHAARSSGLRDLESDFYTKLETSFNKVSPTLALLDTQQETKLKQEMDEMADLEAFRALVTKALALLAGPFDKEARNRIRDEFKALDKKKSVLSDEQTKEIELCLSGVNHFGDYVSDLEDYMQPLQEQGCLTRVEHVTEWQNKLASFTVNHESLPDWPLMASLQRAVKELSDFLKLDAKGQIPEALADSDQFRKKLQSIWSIVENSEL